MNKLIAAFFASVSAYLVMKVLPFGVLSYFLGFIISVFVYYYAKRKLDEMR